MSHRPLRLRAGQHIALLAALTASLSAQTYVRYGAGCPGSAGIPALHAHGLPVLGQTIQIELTQAPAGSTGLLLFGLQRLLPPLDLGFIGSPGCLVLTLPDLTSFAVPAQLGAAAVNIPIPPLPRLTGASFENQWLVVPAGGRITTSNGGTGTIGPLPPPVAVGSITPSNGLLAVGQSVAIRVTGLGTNDPDDLCMQLVDQLGTRSLLRATSITFDPSTGEDVINATLAVANLSPVAQPALMLMRGEGAASATSGTGCLTTPPSAWAWGGPALPGAGATFGTNLIPVPPPTTQTVSWVYDSGSNSLYVDLPPYPWAGSGLYPPGSSLTTDAHGDLACGGGTPTDHFDQFLQQTAVRATCTAGLTNQQMVVEHAPQVQQTFDNFFGAGRLTITAETTGALARIRIRPTNPNCTMTGGGGSVVIGM
ncbi:MAG: hypothetical protein IPM29_20055 [Planctomycetes bacterium]|nr:hypothetical protein [Planctomycetota bacterium]